MPNIPDGKWTYRSFFNDPNLQAGFDSLEFGRGNIIIQPANAT